MKDPVAEKLELVIDALQYAHDHSLDINNKNDVRKILEATDPEHKENVDEFAVLLINADAYMATTAKEKEAKKTDLSN